MIPGAKKGGDRCSNQQSYWARRRPQCLVPAARTWNLHLAVFVVFCFKFHDCQVTVVKLKRTKLLHWKVTESIGNNFNFLFQSNCEGEPLCCDSFGGSFMRHSLYSCYLQTCSLPKVVRQLLGWVMFYIVWLEVYLATPPKNTVEGRRKSYTIFFRIHSLLSVNERYQCISYTGICQNKVVLVSIFILVQI